MSDKSTRLESMVLDPADKLASERTKKANDLIENARLPITLFLADCLAAVDKEYLTTIVGRFILTKYDPVEGNRLYKGLTDVNDDDWMERSSLAEYDILFLLHFFSFAIGTSHDKRVAKGWHPNLDRRLNLEPMLRRKLSVLIEWRNIAEHKQKKLKDERRLHSLTRDYAEFLSWCLTIATGKHSDVFSSSTVQMLKDFVRRYEVVDSQATDRWKLITGVVLVGFICACVWYLTGADHGTKTHTVVMLLAEPLESRYHGKLVNELLATINGSDSMRFVVYMDSTSTFMDRTVASDSQGVQLCVQEMFAGNHSMADLTKLTAAFHAGYKEMMGLDSVKSPAHLFIVGHVPPLSDALYDELKRTGWSPSNDTAIVSNWKRRNFPRPRWVFVNTATSADRDFFQNIMHSRDSTLKPYELQL